MTKTQKNHTKVQQSKSHTSYVFQDRKVLGYDLDNDLQVHYDFLEYLYLLATGHFPNPNQKQSLDLILRNLTLCTANSTPLHASRASRCSGGSTEATIITALASADQPLQFSSELSEGLKQLGHEVDSIDAAFEAIGISHDFARTFGLFFSSFGTLAEAFRGDATFAQFPVSLPLYEYEK